MTLRDLLGVIQGPVKLVVHVTNGTSEMTYTNSAPGPETMLSALGVLDPPALDKPVHSVNSENSPLRTGAGSFFNDGPAVTVVHILKRRTTL